MLESGHRAVPEASMGIGSLVRDERHDVTCHMLLRLFQGGAAWSDMGATTGCGWESAAQKSHAPLDLNSISCRSFCCTENLRHKTRYRNQVCSNHHHHHLFLRLVVWSSVCQPTGDRPTNHNTIAFPSPSPPVLLPHLRERARLPPPCVLSRSNRKKMWLSLTAS